MGELRGGGDGEDSQNDLNEEDEAHRVSTRVARALTAPTTAATTSTARA